MIPCSNERQIGKFENNGWTTMGMEFGRYENDISNKLVNKVSYASYADLR